MKLTTNPPKKKVVPKKHLWSSICIIWGYLFGGLGLGFVTGIIQIEVPCVSEKKVVPKSKF